MKLFGTMTAALRIILVAGLAVAYLSPFAGWMGYADAQGVILAMLTGAAVAFVAALAYFGATDFRLSRRLGAR